MHTEAEAKTKWCPFARPQDGRETATTCIASGCMMWRQHHLLDTEYPRVGRVSYGYCGLAGSPRIHA